MPRRPARRPRATGAQTVRFYWENPPGPRSGGTIERVWRGRVYERDVGPEDLLDVHEAAAALGSRHALSVYRAIWEGRLQAVRRGRSVLIPLRAVTAYLAEASRPGPRGQRRGRRD